MGRWLGVSHKIGPLMSYWVLPISGIPISCVTVQRITNTESTKEEIILMSSKYDNAIEERMRAKNVDNGKEMGEQPAWNRLSLEDEDNDYNGVNLIGCGCGQ